ncbi:hypothetical protein BN3658_01764 [Coriobacteriaceae bacterium CHKCI002]|nr:hypothetical protein BN3658_01764 [Coriobacteriaceae bacterium CHKCI002]
MRKGVIRAASAYNDCVIVEMDDGGTCELHEGDQVILDDMAFKLDSTLEKDGRQWMLKNCQGETYLQGSPVTVHLD